MSAGKYEFRRRQVQGREEKKMVDERTALVLYGEDDTPSSSTEIGGLSLSQEGTVS